MPTKVGKPEIQSKPARRKIVVLATPSAQSLEVAGPMEVFGSANFRLREAGRARATPYEVILASTHEDLRITSATSGLQLLATTPWYDLTGDIDTILVVGGISIWTGASSHRLLRWLREQSRKVRRLGSVCTGAFVLAQAGLLNHRRATTHWCFTGKLKEDYPEVIVDPDPIFIRDGRIVTAAGVAAGIDLCLSLIEEDLGLDIALRVARSLVLFVRRSGGEHQFSTALAFQNTSKIPLRELPIWIVENLAAPLNMEDLASRLGMSVRNFSRTFAREFGSTPAKFVLSMRVQSAKRMLTDSDKSMETIASECGFGSVDSMQRAFRQQTGRAPSSFRVGRHGERLT
ncbi:MAG: GlxA family transcriptional regulator [Acidobacteria bacterium]|nr:GlxA family transcriptional regulator [Acidobacteriota bacterium]